MISLKTIRKFRCPFAICITLSIALVLGCDLLCDLGLISFQLPQPSLVSESTIHSHDHEDEHHSSGNRDNQQSYDQESVKHHHESTNEEGCCGDLTQRFYSSLINAAGTQVSLVHAAVYKLITTITFVDLNESYLKEYLLFTSKFDHRPNGPPGYTGHRIRVLFCSFLI